MAILSALNVYPVKACRGIALAEARLTHTGFEHDREWLIVRPDGRFLTQREEPRLALIGTALSASTLTLTTPQGSTFQGTTSQAASLVLPLDHGGAPLEVTCWRDRCAAFDAGEEAAAFLTRFLGKPVRLARFDPRGERRSNAEYTQGIEAFTHFADAFGWLAICEASLEDLNCRLPVALPMSRFRPNIVLSGLEAYGEDAMHELTAEGVRLRRVKGCTRCVVTTTDQQTGERTGAEPLETLKQYRYDPKLRGVIFGQNLILIEGAGRWLRVGQAMETTAH